MNATPLPVALIAAALLCSISTVRAATPPHVVTPTLARIYDQVARDLSDDSLNPEAALTALASVKSKDEGNAYHHYLTARALGVAGDWEKAGAEIELGNKAAYAVHYQFVDTPTPWLPVNAVMRQLARGAGEAAPALGAEKGSALVKTFRTAGRKVAWSQPRSFITVLAGVSLRTIAGSALVKAFPEGGQDASLAQKSLDADRAFSKKLGAAVRTAPGINPAALASKHKLDPAEIQAASEGDTVDAGIKVRMTKMRKELEAREGPLIAKWLKTLPD